jgi:hypothetical protein
MKQLKVELMALCDYASVSREGKLSINGIFDEIRVQKLPGGMPRAFLVATITGEPEKKHDIVLKLEIENGDKTPLKDLNLNATTSPNGKSNLIIELVELGFEKEGVYRFRIFSGGKEIGSTILKVFENSKKYNIRDIKLPN